MGILDYSWDLTVEWDDARHTYKWSVYNTTFSEFDVSGYEDTVDEAFNKLVEYKRRMVDHPIEYLQSQITNYLNSQQLKVEWDYDADGQHATISDDHDVIEVYTHLNALYLAFEIVTDINNGKFKGDNT